MKRMVSESGTFGFGPSSSRDAKTSATVSALSTMIV